MMANDPFVNKILDMEGPIDLTGLNGHVLTAEGQAETYPLYGKYEILAHEPDSHEIGVVSVLDPNLLTGNATIYYVEEDDFVDWYIEREDPEVVKLNEAFNAPIVEHPLGKEGNNSRKSRQVISMEELENEYIRLENANGYLQLDWGDTKPLVVSGVFILMQAPGEMDPDLESNSHGGLIPAMVEPVDQQAAETSGGANVQVYIDEDEFINQIQSVEQPPRHHEDPNWDPQAPNGFKSEAKSKCQCWNGYERVPGTKPCAPGSCRKCDDHRKKESKYDHKFVDYKNGLREKGKKKHHGEEKEASVEITRSSIIDDHLIAMMTPEELDAHLASTKIAYDEDPEFEHQDDQPQPEDWVIYPSGTLGSQLAVARVDGPNHMRRIFLEYFTTEDEAIEAIKAAMEEEQFWPNVWFQDDHGGYSLVNLSQTEESPSEGAPLLNTPGTRLEGIHPEAKTADVGNSPAVNVTAPNFGSGSGGAVDVALGAGELSAQQQKIKGLTDIAKPNIYKQLGLSRSDELKLKDALEKAKGDSGAMGDIAKTPGVMTTVPTKPATPAQPAQEADIPEQVQGPERGKSVASSLRMGATIVERDSNDPSGTTYIVETDIATSPIDEPDVHLRASAAVRFNPETASVEIIEGSVWDENQDQKIADFDASNCPEDALAAITDALFSELGVGSAINTEETGTFRSEASASAMMKSAMQFGPVQFDEVPGPQEGTSIAGWNIIVNTNTETDYDAIDPFRDNRFEEDMPTIDVYEGFSLGRGGTGFINIYTPDGADVATYQSDEEIPEDVRAIVDSYLEQNPELWNKQQISAIADLIK